MIDRSFNLKAHGSMLYLKKERSAEGLKLSNAPVGRKNLLKWTKELTSLDKKCSYWGILRQKGPGMNILF